MNYLKEYDSPGKVENAAKRHMSLCRQTAGGEKYESLMKPVYDGYQLKLTALQKAEDEKDMATDVVYLCDNMLDDTIRKGQARAKEFDRENMTEITTMIFPKGNISDIVNAPIRKEPDLALELAQKIESLGNDHALYPLAAEIRAQVEKCKAAFADEAEKIKLVGQAEVEVTLAKLAVIKQYSSNYFIAAQDHGKQYAENLFPRLYTRKPKEEVPAEEDEETGAEASSAA